MIEQIFKYSMIVGIIIGFLFIMYTNFSKNRKDKTVIYLNLFVLFFTLNNLQITLADYGFINLNFFSRKLLLPFYALIIPAFYTFVTYYLKADNKLKSFVKISLGLFVVEIIFRFVLGFYFYDQYITAIVAQYAKYEEVINLSFTVFLFLKVVYVFMEQSKYYQEVASYDNMRWMKQFLLLGFVIIMLWIVAVVFNVNEVLTPNIPIYYPLRFFSTFLIFWISYHGFFNYNLLTERIQLRAEIENDIEIQDIIFEVFANKDEIFVEIENFIIAQKKYLIPDYSIENLSSDTNYSEKKLSQILHKNAKCGFPDYINSFRVENAKKLLVDKKYSHYTIVSIGLESGFNSKSTFYRAFQKLVGMTPTAFREQNT